MKLLMNTLMLLVFTAAAVSTGGYTVHAQATRIDEKFDSVTPPAFPAGWSVDVPTIAGYTTWTTNAGCFNPATPGPPSGPNIAVFQSYNLPAGSTARLITPTLNWTAVTTPTFTFKWRRAVNYLTSIDQAFIDASTDNGTTWTEIAGPYVRPTDIPFTTYWQDITVAGAALAPYAGQSSVKFAFRAVSAYGNWIHIDNVFIGQPLVNDLGITAITAPPASFVRSAQTITAAITNFGSAAQSTFNMHVKAWKTIGGSEGSPEFNQTESGPAVTAGATVPFSFATQWTPLEFGGYTVKVYTELAGDETPGNDAFTKSVTVNPAIDLQVTAIVYPPTSGLYIGTLGYSVRGTVKNNGASTVAGADYAVSGLIGPTPGFPGSATYTGAAISKPDIAPGASVNVDLLPSSWVPVAPGPHTARINVTLAGDEIPSNDTRDEARTVLSPHYGGGGTGTGGYYFANSTPGGSGAPSQPTYSWLDPVSAGHTEVTTWTSGTGDDGYFGAVTLPFSFLYFGNTYTSFYIGSNGIVTFGAGSSSRSYTSIPSSASPNNLIAGAWNDMDCRTSTYSDAHIYYGGDASKFAVTFLHAHKYGSATDYITFQIILKLNGNIIIQYNNGETTSPPPTTITDACAVGIENSDGTLGVQYRYNGAAGPMFGSPLAVEFGLDQASLPVQIVSFTGRVLSSSGGVRLDWTTISETNNYGFSVERKMNGQSQYQLVPNSFVPGHGTTNVPQHYLYADSAATPGVWYYRLKQVDLDGTIHFTDGIQVDILTSVGQLALREFALFQNYPNPFNPSTEIKFSVEKTDRAKLEVYNIVGQRIATLFDDVAESGQYYKVRFNAGQIASGVYIYRLQSGKKTDLKKLVLLK